MKWTLAGLGIALLALSALGPIGCAANGDPGWTGAGGTSCAGCAGNGGAANGGDGGQGGSTDTSAVPAKRAGGSGTGNGGMPASDKNKDIPPCVSGLPQIGYFMSADDSNSMASPAIAREELRAGLAPDPSRIRTYEFLNYYNALYDLPDASQGKLGVHVDMQRLPDGADKLLRFQIQVGVQAFQVPRVPLVLTYVIDTSGSLVGPGIERTRAALLAIGEKLQAGDIVNVVTWANQGNVLLENYVAQGGAADQDKLAEVVNGLVPGGGSDLHAGLLAGYKLAQQHFDTAKLNRVVLVSDGGANLGVTDRDAIAGAAAQAQDEGIYLVGIGVGPQKGYSDTLMNLVTDAGRGAYVYLDSTDEAKAVFKDRFDEIMNVAARDVSVEVDLTSYLDIEHFYGEQYSQDASQVAPQNLAPGDSMVFDENVVVTDLAAMCGGDPIQVKVKWRTPIQHEERSQESAPVTFGTLLASPPSPQMIKARAVIAYAESLKTNTAVDVGAALATVDDASKQLPTDDDLKEIHGLLQLHPALTQ
jgi:Ca-activated chloride channel family protein